MGVRDDVVENESMWPAKAFNALIKEMTAMLPQHRPPSMHDVADRLRTILAG